MGVNSERIDCAKIALIGTVCNGRELVGLSIEAVESLLACKHGLLQDCNLLLCNRLGSLGHKHDVCAVLRFGDIWNTYLGGNH